MGQTDVLEYLDKKGCWCGTREIADALKPICNYSSVGHNLTQLKINNRVKYKKEIGNKYSYHTI